MGQGTTTTSTQDTGRGIVGTFRRIGELGPAYEVLKIVNETEATIQILESGEVLDYPIADILEDPDADA